MSNSCIPSHRGRGRSILPIALMAAAIVGLTGCGQKMVRKIPPLPVQVATVTRGNLPLTVNVLGQAVASHSVTVVPQVSGTIAQVAVHSGHIVHQGQLLFTIDPRSYQEQVAEDAANLRGEIAQARYDALQVKAYKPLVQKDYVTLQTYQQAVASAQTAEASVAADRAALAQAQLNLSYTRITAPITGKIGLLTIKSGNLVAANSTTLTTIEQTQPVLIQFSLPEKDLGDLRRALASKADTVTVRSENEGPALGSGPVTAIDNSVNSTSADVTAQAQLPNPGYRIWAGEYVQVSFRKQELRNALLIPSSALEQGESGPFVYQIQKGKAVMHPVTFLGQHGEETAIESNLAVGTRVVVGAPARLRPGASVRAMPDRSIEPAAKPAAALGAASKTRSAGGAA